MFRRTPRQFPCAVPAGHGGVRTVGGHGESAPENWEEPFGTSDVHVGPAAPPPDAAGLERVLAGARTAYADFDGVTALWRLDCQALPTEAEAFGFRDGISHPAIESGIPGSNPRSSPSKRVSSFSATRMNGANCPPPQPEALARTAPTSCSASCTNGWPRSVSIQPNSSGPRRRNLAATWTMAMPACWRQPDAG